MKPKPIGEVLARMTTQRLMSLAEQAERARLANVRLERIEMEAARKQAQAKELEEQRLAEMGYPEYRSARNAAWKRKRYHKHLQSQAWERKQAEMLLRRAQIQAIKKNRIIHE